MLGLPSVPGFLPEARPFPVPLPLPDLPTAGPGRGVPGIPRLLPRLPGGLPDLNPNPLPGDSGDYWSVPNNAPGGPGAEWPSGEEYRLPKPGTLVIRVVQWGNGYTLRDCSDDWANRPNLPYENAQQVMYSNVTRFTLVPHTTVGFWSCGSGEYAPKYQTAGMEIWVDRGSGETKARSLETQVPLSWTIYGSKYGQATFGNRYEVVSFDGAPLRPPREVPDYWPGRGFPERAPDLLPAPDGFVPGGPYAPKPPERKAPPVPLTPAAPPNLVPIPAPAPPRVPAPVPPRFPQPAPSATPKIQPKPAPGPGVAPATSPGTRPALPEVTPAGVPQPAPLPVPVTPSWAEQFLGEQIGEEAQRDRATLPEIARQAGKLEQKSRIIGERQQGGAVDSALGELLKQIYDYLSSFYPGGSYELWGPCERNEDGSIKPPIEVSWQGGQGSMSELGKKIDAIAELIQAHKTMGQPMCVKERQGKPVTVILREVR